MNPLKQAIASMEDIAFQHNSVLYAELTRRFSVLKSNGKVTQKALDKLNLSKLVFDQTGMKITFKIESNPYWHFNAYVSFDHLSKNNVFLSSFVTKILNGDDDYKRVKKLIKTMEGYIDQANGKVSGFFSEIPAKVGLGSQLLEEMTPGECAAITLHELGHQFGNFEYLGRVYTVNLALQTMTNALRGAEQRTVKVDIIRSVANDLEIPGDLDKLADSDPDKARAIMLGSMNAIERRSTLSTRWDSTSFEYIADQFPSRHGAGKDLVTALDKLNRKNFAPQAVMAVKYASYVLEVTSLVYIGLIASIGGPVLPLLAGLGLFALGTDKMDPGVYDEPELRLKRIRDQYVQTLKVKSLSDDLKKTYLADLEKIDDVLKDYRNYTGITRRLFNIAMIGQRTRHNQKQLQLELEKIGNNDLFVSSSKLDTLS